MNLSKDIVYITAECLVGLLSILSNSVVLISLYRFQQLQTITNYFVGSLALADMLVGLAVPPVVIYPYFGLPRDFHGCVLVSSLVILLTNISVLNLVAVALERYLAIRRPFLYDRAASHSKALHVIIFTWLLAIVLGLVPVMGWNRGHDTFNGTCGFLAVMDLSYLTYFLFFGFLAPCLLFVFLVYAYIFYTIHRQQRKTSVMVSPQSTLDGPEMLSFAESVPFSA
nr:hypothetical protein BaRGS_018219 [Batillaria attramentaria]